MGRESGRSRLMTLSIFIVGHILLYAGSKMAVIFLPFVLIPALLLGVFLTLLAFTPNEKTRRIVILGSIASGKTTLWNQLRGLGYGREHVQTASTIIDSFKMKGKDHEVTIKATKDIGGGDQWVKEYDNLILEDTFIYYLIDLTQLEGKKCKDTRARLQKISKVISEKELKNCGLKILATHYDQYSRQHRCSKDEVKELIKQLIGFDTIKGHEKIEFGKAILAVNLLDSRDIEIIKEEICSIKR